MRPDYKMHLTDQITVTLHADQCSFTVNCMIPVLSQEIFLQLFDEKECIWAKKS